jgi:hypothetical protein
MNFSKIPRQQNKEQDAAEREFDAYLREIDDYLPNQIGNVSGFTVSPDFVPRVIEQARTEMHTAAQAAAEGWTIQRWFLGFSLATRMAIASAVLVATFCGFRAGQVVTDVIARRTRPQPTEVADPLGLAAPEQAIVQLIRNEGLTTHSQPNRPGGEQ